MNIKTITLSLSILLLTSCTHYIYISRCIYQQKSVIADGKPNEWKLPLKFYDDKSKLQYTVSNDFQNIYVCIRATDQKTQYKIMRAGMQLWIDTTGEYEHKVGLLFPLSNSLRKTNPNEMEAPPKSKQDVSAYKNKFLNGYKEMELAGFNTGINGMSPIKNSAGIQAAINWDTTDIMTYEAIIPFKTFYKDSITVHDSLKLFGISIIVNALQPPESKHESAGTGGGMPGGGMRGAGGGGMHGGGGHGGGHSGGADGNSFLYETNSIKMLFQLSGAKPKASSEYYTK